MESSREALWVGTFLVFGGPLGPALTLLLPVLYFLLLFLGQGASVLLAYRMASLAPEEVGPVADPPFVSVIIPARNEKEDLPLLLEDLAHQDYAGSGGRWEVWVVDDGSTDGTGEVAARHPSHPQVLQAPPPPPGWVGKNWACHQGAQRATGALLLFLDADVRLGRTALRAAVERQRATGADLVSFAARVVMESFWERVVMPLYVQFVLLYFQTPRVNDDRSSRAMANGQFMCFSREGYGRSGGHERVRGAVLEDVRLAQEIKRAGGRVRVLWTPQMVTTRMYQDRAEMGEGILKTLHGTRFSYLRQFGLAAGLFLLYLSPFLVLALWAAGLLGLLWALSALAAVLVTLGKQVGFQRALLAPARYGLLYPLGCVYYLGLFAISVRRGAGQGRVAWKGRTYAMESGPG